MNRYYYSFWIRLLDIYPINQIAWALIARSYKNVHHHRRLYRIWDRLFSDIFYLWCARVKVAEKPGDIIQLLQV